MLCKYLLVSLTTLFLFAFINTSQAISIGTDTYFILSDYSTYIDFQSTTDFTTITVDSDYVDFDSYRLIVQNGNVTFSSWFIDDTLQFSTSWSSGGKTTFYMNGSSTIQTPYKITYLSTQPTFYWLGTNNTLKLEISNPDTIEIFWIGEDEPIPPSPTPPEEEPIPPSPIIVPGEEPPQIVIPPGSLTNLIKIVYPYAPYIYLGGLALTVTISLAFLYGKVSNKKFRTVLGGPYNPHRKRTGYHKPKSTRVSLKVKKSKNPRLRVKKRKMPRLKEEELYD